MTHALDAIEAVPNKAGRKPKYSKEDAEAISRARARGVTWRQIAEHYGVNPLSAPNTFSSVLRRYGVGRQSKWEANLSQYIKREEAKKK
jgi:hypothetical protein